MRQALFHLVAGDMPHRSIEIEFAPFSLPLLAGAHEGERKELGTGSRQRTTAIVCSNVAHQLASGHRQGNGGHWLHLGGDERALKGGSRVMFAVATRHGVAKYE